MFIGHYAPAILGASTGRIKLWQAFVGAQLVDYGWSVLNLMGVEKTRIVDGFTQASALDLYHMPYTHSLGMSILWALVGALLFALIFKKQARAGALIFGLVVLSHWFMDLIVHVPDLPLWFGGEKYGFGLWKNRNLSFALELILFLGAMVWYLKNSAPKGRAGKIWPSIFIGFMVLLQIFGNYGPPPPSVKEMNISALFIYTVFALGAWGLDKTRQFKIAK